ncbi:MAG: helix-turn-helix transcriptional regulator [Clostridia bacterium]|nr:helix-turn-helix transcriptional regulator [Clostridia bacterium]
MDWIAIGARIRKQREFLGFTREELAEKIEVTPKFCSDIELGVKGMSVPTLCRIARSLNLSADYILFGSEDSAQDSPAISLLQQCPLEKRGYLEDIIKAFSLAIETPE